MICKKTILSISYGDYFIDKGGVFKMIYSHQLMMNEAGYDYIYAYPVLRLSQSDEFCWHLIVNGSKNKDIFSTDGLIYYLTQKRSITNIFIHHLMRLQIKDVSRILDAFNQTTIFFYVHDYYTLCNQYTLLRDGKTFCGTYGKNETCKGCSAYLSSEYNRDEIVDFFRKHNGINIIAPSDSAKDIWIKGFPFMKDQVIVIYHQRLIGQYKKNKEEIFARKINIAFVGASTGLKGWDDWKKTINSLSGTSKDLYSFYAFGNAKETIDGLKTIHVNTTNDPDAMVRNLRKYNIDVVFLGSICPETYSYTYYEAFAANAYIISNRFSGNIASQTIARYNGYIYDTLDDVISLLEDYSAFSKIISDFKKSSIYGPETLEENKDILNHLSEQPATGIAKEINNTYHFSLKTKIISRLDKTRLGRIALYRFGGR